jgi:hypothetical protein
MMGKEEEGRVDWDKKRCGWSGGRSGKGRMVERGDGKV